MRTTIFAAAILLITAGSAAAQQPGSNTTRNNRDERLSIGEVPQTQAMWFYEQELRRYNDPKNAVRRKAELKTAQRMQRIAAMKWFGYSNSRPTVSPTPFTGTYSPGWVSNGYNTSEWIGVGRTTVIVGGNPYYGTGYMGLW